MVPKPNLSNARNAARLAAFAEAAYFADPVQFGAERKLFEEEESNGDCQWWSYGNACGMSYIDDECIVLGIAGTNDRDDVRNDFDLLDQQLGDWSDASDFEVLWDVRNTWSTAGFLGYTALCYAGIEMSLPADPDSDPRPIWLTGHSLGAAAVYLMQATKRYSGAHAFVYGAPRVFRGYVHEALRVSVRRITDPVGYGPFRYRHPPCDTIWVRYPGSVRTAIPWKLQPLAYAYRTAVWTQGLVQQGLISLGVSVRPTLTHGHSMGRYRYDLWPLR